MKVYLLRGISTDECTDVRSSDVPDYVLHGGAAASSLERAKETANEWMESDLEDFTGDDQKELPLEDTYPPSIEWDAWPEDEFYDDGVTPKRKSIRGWCQETETIYSIEELEVYD